MKEDQKIICQHCGKDTGYTAEGFMYCVIESDIHCPHCKGIVIKGNKVMY